MSGELTPWFPADVKPVRKGVYEVRDFNIEKEYSFWDGVEWKARQLTPSHAALRLHKAHTQEKKWRGLASDPSVTP